MEEKNEEIKRRTAESETVVLTNNLENTKKVILKASDKEDKLEEMLMKEEEEREKEEENQIQIQIENEKKKDECLQKSIKEKETEEKYNLARVQIQDQIAKAQAEARKEIEIKRKSLKDRIELMRIRAKLRQKSLQEQLITMRTSTIDRLKKTAKIGNMNNCFIATEANKPVVDKYCDMNFVTNFSELEACKDIKTFCEMCCMSEFNELHLVERKNCSNNKCTPGPGTSPDCDKQNTVVTPISPNTPSNQPENKQAEIKASLTKTQLK
jgi:hypothetical protein